MARTPPAKQDSSVGAGAGTQSCCIFETSNGSHYFKITGYSFAKGMGVGKYISSESFTAGGYQWAIDFYPDGIDAADTCNYVSVYIALVSEGTDVRAVCEFTLLDQSTKAKKRNKAKHGRFDPSLESVPYTQYRGRTWGHKHFYRRAALETSPPMYEPRTFTHPSPGNNLSRWGYSRFYLRTELETSDYLKNDTLLMTCTMGVVVSSTQDSKLYSIPVPKPSLGQHFGALLDSGKDDATFGDVTFEVEGESFQAHKLVLAARSPVFMAQFYGPICDGNNRKIHIKDMEALVFKAMLHFIYRDELPDTKKVIGSKKSLSSLGQRSHCLQCCC